MTYLIQTLSIETTTFNQEKNAIHKQFWAITVELQLKNSPRANSNFNIFWIRSFGLVFETML